MIVFLSPIRPSSFFGMYSCSYCRVRELEGKVRELESSMSRMGQQHDVTMELIETWRSNKEAVSAFGLACSASLFCANAVDHLCRLVVGQTRG